MSKELTFGISINSEEIECIFEVLYEKQIPLGDSEFKLIIPIHFFSEGNYSIDYFILNKNSVVYLKRKTLSFQIDELTNSFKSWGIVKPFFYWEKI